MELVFGLLGIVGLGVVAALLGAIVLDSDAEIEKDSGDELRATADTLTVTRQVVAEMTGSNLIDLSANEPVGTVLNGPSESSRPAAQVGPGEWFAAALTRCSQQFGTGRCVEQHAESRC